jgi:hypothetical protein
LFTRTPRLGRSVFGQGEIAPAFLIAAFSARLAVSAGSKTL